MRIGINALFLIPGEVGGTEIYLTSLLNALREIDKSNEYFVFVNRETSGIAQWAPGVHMVPCPVRARSRPLRIFWEQARLPSALARHNIDVLLNPGFTMPMLAARPSVTVFHDLQHLRHPEYFRWFDLPFWNLLLRASAKRSRSLIAVSEATARDMKRYYSDVAEKTVVIPHGVDPEFFRIGERRAGMAAPSGQEKVLLTVSTLHPHKNIGRLLEAFRMFRDLHPGYRLVIAGLRGHATAEIEALRRDLGLEQSVTLTGWIARSALYDLFGHADAFVAPSLFEGFGMPLIEALAAGLPAAYSDISPLTEIAGGAGTRFHPESVREIADAMELITTDSGFRRHAAIAGPAQAQRFSWITAAELTLRELERASRQNC